MIKISNLKKEYVESAIKCIALNGVNLNIETGTFLSIIGRSGSGKSTLLHILGALESETYGDVIVNGKNINKFTENEKSRYRNKELGFVFQSFFLEPTYTVYKNVELPLLISNVPKRERKQRILATLKQVGLENKIYNRASKLSGGEKQRVCIARSLVNDPWLILADEPCGNLDSENSHNIMTILKELSEQGKTVVLVTHNAADARKYTQRIIELQDGVVISDEVL